MSRFPSLPFVFHVALHRALHRDVAIRPCPSHWGNDDYHYNLAVFVSPTSASLFTFSAIVAAELIAASRQGASYECFEAGMRDAPGPLVEPRRWKSPIFRTRLDQEAWAERDLRWRASPRATRSPPR